MTLPGPTTVHFPLVLAASILVGCGCKDEHHAKESADPHEEHPHEEHPHEGHPHEEESPSGASFKAGKGVSVTEETKGLLGITIAEVNDRPLPNQIQLTLQIFDEKHHHLLDTEDHTGCAVHGSGFVSAEMAAQLKAGQAVALLQGTNPPMGGIVLAVQRALALGESEVVIGISNAIPNLKSGDFVSAQVHLPRKDTVLAIPQSALLRTAEGPFVYVVNGDAYYRTAVKTGSNIDGWVEITDGLLEGDLVVTHPPQSLWLIELRATKGGGHSH